MLRPYLPVSSRGTAAEGKPPRYNDGRPRVWTGRHSLNADGPLAVPAELLRLALRTQAELHVDQRGSAEIHRLIQCAAQILRILDIEALAAERFHHQVVASAPDQ